MKEPKTLARTRGIALRVTADFVLVQAAMFIALTVAGVYSQVAGGYSPREYLNALRSYHLLVFTPLSLVFPLFYSLGGLYTRARSWTSPSRLWRGAVCAALSAGVVLLAGRLVPGSPGLPRSAALVFALLVIVAAPGVRLVKDTLFEEDSRSGSGPETVLVVGGAGYIGSILVRKLLQRKYRVRVLDNLIYGDSAIRDVLGHPRLEFQKGDCRNIKDVVKAMAGVRSVVHLAAIVGDPACDQDHQTAREINYAATRMMIEVAKGEKVGRFVFASSCSVYGASDEVMTEISEPCPISLYAATKVDSEEALLAAESETFHPTILRFATIFGLSPRPRFDLVVNLLTAKARQEGLITIFNGEQWRPFLHVHDAAEAIARVLGAPVELVGGEIYNIGDQRLNYTLTNISELIRTVFPRTRVEHIENTDRRSYRVSFDKVHSQLGFECSRDVKAGILELKQAFDEGAIVDYKHPLYSNVKYLEKHGTPGHNDETGAQVMAALANKPSSSRAAAAVA